LETRSPIPNTQSRIGIAFRTRPLGKRIRVPPARPIPRGIRHAGITATRPSLGRMAGKTSVSITRDLPEGRGGQAPAGSTRARKGASGQLFSSRCQLPRQPCCRRNQKTEIRRRKAPTSALSSGFRFLWFRISTGPPSPCGFGATAFALPPSRLACRAAAR
jgi:hypothetical protein